jgi:hypothetical protein
MPRRASRRFRPPAPQRADSRDAPSEPATIDVAAPAPEHGVGEKGEATWPAVASWFHVGARMLRRAVGSASRRPFAPIWITSTGTTARSRSRQSSSRRAAATDFRCSLSRRLLKLDPDFRFGLRGVCWRLVRRRPSKRIALCPVAVASRGRAALTLPLPTGIAVHRGGTSAASAASSRSSRSLMSGLAECSLRSKAAAPGVATASMVERNCRARLGPIVSSTASSRELATGRRGRVRTPSMLSAVLFSRAHVSGRSGIYLIDR